MDDDDESARPPGAPPVATTAELFLAAQSGNDIAFEQLCRRYLARLRFWATGKLRGQARDLKLTGDLVNEAIMEVVKRRTSFKMLDDRALEKFLRRVLKHLIASQRRRAVRRKTVELSPDHPDAAPTPFDRTLDGETKARLRVALARLDPEERRVIDLRFEQACSHDEGAAALGLPSGDAFRMRVVRALEKLARLMAENEREP